jgi:hypothetical protein
LWFKYTIAEVSCPTKYFAEASSINFRRSVKYGFGCLGTALSFRLAKMNLLPPSSFRRRSEFRRQRKRGPRLVCVALAAATLAVFWGARSASLSITTTRSYITSNQEIQHGLTAGACGGPFKPARPAIGIR